jgi:phosphoribosylglycinamide formyltransferase-1
MLLDMGIAPKALLIEPPRKYVSRRLEVYQRILKNTGISRLLYRMKIDLLDNMENLGIVEKAGSEKSLERGGYPLLYTCGTGSAEWKRWTLDDFDVESLGIEVIYCGNNSDALVNYINDNHVQFVLAGAAQVLQKHIFERTNAFFLNMHPGVLPYMRGMHSDKWAIYYGINPGATLHIMDSGVDTGPIIATGFVPIGENDSIASLRVKAHELCLTLLKEHLPKILSKDIDLAALPKQDLSVGKITEGMGPLRFAICNFFLWMLRTRVRRRKSMGLPNEGMFLDLRNKF